MAFKTFTVGEVLTAANVNTYLATQAVIGCTSGTRPASPQDGMTIYETDTDLCRQWNTVEWFIIGSGVTISYVPTLTASSVNPTLGSGSLAKSWYTRGPGSTLTFEWAFKFGTSGGASGTGQYLVSLPVACLTYMGSQMFEAMGVAMLRDDSAALTKAMTCYISNSGLTTLSMIDVSTIVGATTPWTWANLDSLQGVITYRTAS